MNKKFVYQVGNNKKVILRCTANQISRYYTMVLLVLLHSGSVLGLETCLATRNEREEDKADEKGWGTGSIDHGGATS
jgi:hypothetical protein